MNVDFIQPAIIKIITKQIGINYNFSKTLFEFKMFK